MSFAALAWAAKQKTGGLAMKAALLALANYADEHGCSYPSTAAIADFGEMDHKTAAAALDRLSLAGLIIDTGQKAGRTKQIRVFQLALEATQKSTPKTEASQKRKPSVSSAEAPQKRGTDTIREPVPQKAAPSSGKRADKLDRGVRLPEEFTPHIVGVTAEMVERWPPGRLDREVAQFRDHYAKTGGDKGLSLDWQASLRTWLRNADDRMPRNGRIPEQQSPGIGRTAAAGVRVFGPPG